MPMEEGFEVPDSGSPIAVVVRRPTRRFPGCLPIALAAAFACGASVAAEDPRGVIGGAGIVPPTVDGVPAVPELWPVRERLAQRVTSSGFPDPVLDPAQAGNIGQRLPSSSFADVSSRPGTVLDPNQVGNIDLRLEEARRRLAQLEG
ncbi:MAG: hypothetical protein ACKOCW_02915, partial [Planctomycetaceae bacterium]